tara:strand:+ start:186256 stop:187503 length:1248 start_codon:yes stop_codon:yes gene_type:complete
MKKKYMGKLPRKPAGDPVNEPSNEPVNEAVNEPSGETAKPPRFSLKSIWGRVSKRLPNKGTLKKAFTPAALGVAAGVSAKIAAMAVGASILGPIFTAVAGVGLTTHGFIKDYKEDGLYESKLDFFKDNWKKYTVKLGLNSVSALVGFGGAEMALNYFGVGQEAITTIGDTINNAPCVDDVPCDSAPIVETAPEPTPEPTPEPEPIPEPELVIPEDAYEKLAMLAENENLSAQARNMIDAALNGQTWAIRDVGLGLINGQYGFDELGELAGHVSGESWGAELLQDAAETGDAKARVDIAYFQYTGMNEFIAIDQEAALKTVEELDRSWLHGESILEQIHFDQAKEQFILAMPEGTDINDYRMEVMADGYKFINIAEEAANLAEQKIAMREAGLDPAACDIRQNADNMGYTIRGCSM